MRRNGLPISRMTTLPRCAASHAKPVRTRHYRTEGSHDATPSLLRSDSGSRRISTICSLLNSAAGNQVGRTFRVGRANCARRWVVLHGQRRCLRLSR